jgi:aryl-alcohol dehydrogenase-like predicted oxidoreductase
VYLETLLLGNRDCAELPARKPRREPMPLNHYVTLGRSGLRVSPFCLGAMTFGEDLGPGTGSSVKESEQIIDRYLELGGNFIDTANFYMRGHSEKIIGDHLAHDREKRDRVVIATKFSGNLYPGDPNGGGSNRKAIIAACEQSLRRLRTDYIDLYYLHIWDKHTPIEETVLAMHDLVQAGKVRYLGISDTPSWKVAQAQLLTHFRGWAPFIALQIEYSLAERTVEGELIPMAQELGLGVVPWSPLASGRLSGKYTPSSRDRWGRRTTGSSRCSPASPRSSAPPCRAWPSPGCARRPAWRRSSSAHGPSSSSRTTCRRSR